MRIYLIRHGRTEANERHLYCGKTDIPLSKEGKAELMGRRDASIPGARYLSSGLKRCNETLEILFEGAVYEVIPEFQEIDFGIFEMKSYEELKSDPAYQAWLSGDNEANCPPGGESGNHMRVRVMAAFRAVQESGEDTVIVTHGGMIAALMGQLFPEENKNRYEWQPRPGCGYVLANGGYAVYPEE